MKTIARIFLGLVFIFSGFVKCIDPWGGAIKIADYLSAFNLDFFSFLDFPLAVALSVVELSLGLMLVFDVARKLTAKIILGFMVFFSVLTLFIALTNPVSDCGCFGDAIKLTNWQTFIKNAIILLPLSIYVVKNSTRNKHNKVSFVFISLGLLLNLYCYLTLPIMDFRPFKIGTDIAQEMNFKGNTEVKTTVLYRNLSTQEIHEFELTDTTWWDSNLWEYVDTKSVINTTKITPKISNFAIYTEDKDITDYVLSADDIYLIVFTDINKAKLSILDDLDPNVEKIIVTINASQTDSLAYIPIYKMDNTTLKTMIRAKNGLVRLKKGVITEKTNLLLQ